MLGNMIGTRSPAHRRIAPKTLVTSQGIGRSDVRHGIEAYYHLGPVFEIRHFSDLNRMQKRGVTRYPVSHKIQVPCNLFPSHWEETTEEKPISDKTVWNACHEAALRAGITNRLGPTRFATHMLEATDLRTIQLLFGHRRLKETAFYLHLSRRHLLAAINALDQISLSDFPKQPAPPESAHP